MMRGRPDDCDAPTGADRSTKMPTQKRSLIGRSRVARAILAVGLLSGLIGGLGVAPSARGGEAFEDGIGALPAAPPPQPFSAPKPDARERIAQLVTRVIAETSEVWTDVLPQQKGTYYAPPQLVLYDGATHSACGPTFTAIGPFYCPLDQKIYLDPSFFSGVKAQLGGAGDLAYTFLLAHEVGHHVQNELGILHQVQTIRRSAFGTRDNPMSIRIELMADCFAGVWAANAEAQHHLLAASDVAQLDATAQAIGDDRLEQAAQGIVVAATFTHGTSEQRAYWFERGVKSGSVDSCNTFAH